MPRGVVPDQSTVGGRIVAARLEAGMKQRELADLIHVSERSMQAYESDEVVPYLKIMELSEMLNKTPAWLLHGEEALQTPQENIKPLLTEIRDLLKKQLDLMS